MKRSQWLILITIFILLIVWFFSIILPASLLNLFFLALQLFTAIMAIVIFFGKKSVEKKVAWIIFILLLPGIGVLFYFLFGAEYYMFKRISSKNSTNIRVDKLVHYEQEKLTKINKKQYDISGVLRLIQSYTKSPVCLHTKTEILTNGDTKFPRLFEELRKAEKFINIEYFILKEGRIFNEFKKILINKAKNGVKVRLLYDDFGSIDFSNVARDELTAAGVEVAIFNEINFKLLRPSINYRTHRKIVVIDNKVGFTGGMNIGDEYDHLDAYYGFWRDTHILVEGDAVKYLNLVFVKDWLFTTDQLLLEKEERSAYKMKFSSGGVQVIEGGPDTDSKIVRDIYLKLINEAKESLYIETPYLIPDSGILDALKLAAKSGVDVRIIIPGKPDKRKDMIYKATEAYATMLIRAGVQVFKYNRHFIHSKILIVDGKIASVGTVNFDARSFDLNFEVTILLYFTESIETLLNDFSKDLKKSKKMTLKDWEEKSILDRALAETLKIFSPLM